MGVDDLPLGKITDYPTSFSRDLLSRIPRSDSRENLAEDGVGVEFTGYDLWTVYELGWISSSAIPAAMVGEIRIPADSEFIVESKSLKLYINSLYYRRFDSADQVRDEISLALSTLLKTQVVVHLWPLADFGGTFDNGRDFINLDQLDIAIPNASGSDLLEIEKAEKVKDYTKAYKTELFRSLCPVTGQPDWATLYIAMQGVRPDIAGLAAYLLGYNEHQGFHESCVEQIYTDLKRALQPDELTVAARFTRRGGIDINPYRTSAKPLFQMPARTPRQ